MRSHPQQDKMCLTLAATNNSPLDWKAEWSNIKTYDGLTDANVAFLEGRMLRTPYHFAPLDPETAPLVPRLVQLNNLGFVSFCGQPAEIIDTHGCLHEQRSWIEGFMLAHHLPRLEAFAKDKRRDGYYFMVSRASKDAPEILFHTFPKRMLARNAYWQSKYFNLTRFKVNKSRKWDTCTNMWIEPRDKINVFDNDDDTASALTTLLAEQCIVVEVVGRHYGRGSVEDVLLEFLGAH